jgi:hypothetical protein
LDLCPQNNKENENKGNSWIAITEVKSKT